MEGQEPSLEAEPTVDTAAEPTVETSTEPTVDAGSPAPSAEGEIETPTYEPNYMFKVHGQEKEFDDWAKPLVKDADSEQQYREIMEKVYGIDHIKEDREALRTENTGLQEVAQKYQTLETELGTLDQFIQHKNFDAFFQKTQIQEQDVLQWAAKRLQYYEMTPEQRAEHDRSIQAQTNEVYFGQQAAGMQEQMQQLKYEQNQFRLEQNLAQPGISEQVAQYDQRLGAGAFRQAVEERGLFHYHQSGKDIPVEQAIQEVMMIAGMQTQQVQSQVPPQGVPQAQMPQTPSAMPQAQKKPVIPQVDGSGASPVKQVVRSIEDLKNISRSRS
jgi:hypothetical protein